MVAVLYWKPSGKKIRKKKGAVGHTALAIGCDRFFSCDQRDYVSLYPNHINRSYHEDSEHGCTPANKHVLLHNLNEQAMKLDWYKAPTKYDILENNCADIAMLLLIAGLPLNSLEDFWRFLVVGRKGLKDLLVGDSGYAVSFLPGVGTPKKALRFARLIEQQYG